MGYDKTTIITDCCLTADSPACLLEGELLQNETGTKKAIRLIFKNSCGKNITAVGVIIHLYDKEGNQVKKPVKCWYKKICIADGKVFGYRQLIPVYSDTETFKLEIAAVKFEDGSFWKTGETFDATSIAPEKKESQKKPDNEEIIKPDEPVAPMLSPEEQAKLDEENRIRKEKNKKRTIIIAAIVGGAILIAALAFAVVKVIIPTSRYNSAVALMNSKQYDEAVDAFAELKGYKDSADKITECRELKLKDTYQGAVDLMNAGKYLEAMEIFETIPNYSDSSDKIEQCEEATREERYNQAKNLAANGDYTGAKEVFLKLKDYENSAESVIECDYQIALQTLNNKQYDDAAKLFEDLGNYKDSKDQIKESQYRKAMDLYDQKQFDDSNAIFSKLGNYKESKSHIHEHKYAEEMITEPTCTETGVKKMTCSCGKTYNETVPALGHSYTNVSVSKEPTCTTTGTRVYTCRCGDSKTETIPALGHQYVQSVTREASCKANGEITYTCANCGDSYTETIPKTGHVYSEGTCWDEPYCIYCGETKGKPLGHTTKQGRCSRCGMYIRDGEEWDSYEDWYDYSHDY